jgi:signal peptidase
MSNNMMSPPKSPFYKLLTVIGVLMCIILIPALIINISLLIKSYMNNDAVPNIGGYMILVALSDDMYPEIQKGDLIICHTIEAEDVKEGDVIVFFDPDGNKISIVTSRVVVVTGKNGEKVFYTKGDAEYTDDVNPVPADNLVGICRKRIAGAGNIAVFLQTTPGLVACILCPFLILIGYDIIRSPQSFFNRIVKKRSSS